MVTCVDDGEHLGGFEWCVNAPAVDSTGVVYANSEDGNLYAIQPDGTEKERFFLTLALGAAYTPLSIDYAGRIFAMNHGELIVVGE
jgi:outer membrane protein assembly factor BamB